MAALLFLAVLAQACASRPIRADWLLGSLKETGKRELLQTEGEYSAAASDVRKVIWKLKHVKPILAETPK